MFSIYTPWLCSGCKPAVSENSFDSLFHRMVPQTTLQILVKLFFTASQMGDRNQIKQFVQFLASCMLEIKIMPGCT